MLFGYVITVTSVLSTDGRVGLAGSGGTSAAAGVPVAGTNGLPPDGYVRTTVSGRAPQSVQVAAATVKPYGTAVGVAKTGGDARPR